MLAAEIFKTAGDSEMLLTQHIGATAFFFFFSPKAS